MQSVVFTMSFFNAAKLGVFLGLLIGVFGF